METGRITSIFFFTGFTGVWVHRRFPQDLFAGFFMGLYTAAIWATLSDPTAPHDWIVAVVAFFSGYLMDYVLDWYQSIKQPKQEEPIKRGPMEEFKRAYHDQTFRRNYLFIKWQKDFDLIYNDHIGSSEGFSVGFFYQKEGDIEIIHQFVDGKRQDGWLVLEQENLGGPYKKYRFTCERSEPQSEPITKDEPVVDG